MDSDDLAEVDILEKDIHGWPEEFEWLQEELQGEKDDPPPLSLKGSPQGGGS